MSVSLKIDAHNGVMEFSGPLELLPAASQAFEHMGKLHRNAEKTMDFNFRGLRIRSMECLPAGSMMICDASNSPKAIYTTEKGWRAVDEEALKEAHTLILSMDLAAEIAKRVNFSLKDQPEHNLSRAQPGEEG